MQASTSFKLAFLKHMLMGIKLAGVFSKSMSFQEKKRAIKHSADAALALARGNTSWSQALVADLAKQEKDNALVKGILGKGCNKFTKTCNKYSWKVPKSKKILRRSLRARSRKGKSMPSSVIARRMVKKKTQVLKRLIPGGDSLDKSSLLDEALDYALYLRAQVDLMRRLAGTLGA